ncbi:hypothetical protein BD769DRAFT_1386892 [Suillus cothurnatus]|nr:hypothetical protein BD769DRAFT_1386892 [Suillus cothurnatus]
MTHELKVFVRDGKVFTSLTADFLPKVIPYQPPWNPRDDHDYAPNDSDVPLTPRWAYASRPWFPVVPLNPRFDGPIFECLNHTRFSLRTEVDAQGKHMLHHDIRGRWYELEKKLIWCQERLGAGMFVPWGTVLPSAPATFGYLRSHENAKLAIKVALRSRNAFLLIGAACTWHIMSRRYRGSNRPWMSVLTDDRECPIPAEWVLELSHSFVGDLSANVQCTRLFISSTHCPWEGQLPMFEHFSIPIWVHCAGDASVIDSMLHRYIPSRKVLISATDGLKWGQTPADGAWGHAGMWGSPENQHQHLDGGEPQAEPDLVWGDVPSVSLEHHEQVPSVSLFPEPERNSGQLQGEDWQAFLARRREGNKKREEKETPAQRQVHLSRTTSAGNQDLPTKKTTVFEWQPQDEFDGFRLRIRIMKNDVYSVWREYSATTRVYDSFRNEWDLCDELDPTSVPDGDWEDEIFAPSPSPPPPALLLPPPPQPPSRSSFLQDINQYFGQHEVASSSTYSHGVEHFVLTLSYHLGFQLAASTSAPQGRSATFESWIRKTQWLHLCRLIGDVGTDVSTILDAQKDIITCFIGYLVMLPTSGLPEMPSDLWDLGPECSLAVSNAGIRVSYAQLPQQRLYVIEPSLSASLVVWKLVVADTATAVMCLRRDWGSDITKIALNLLQKGITFKTLQAMAVAPDTRRPCTELHSYSPTYTLPPFKAVYADYIVYEQHHHEFMNQPRARAALLHGGLVWRLALHSFGFDDLPSVLEGISWEAVPYGLMLLINDQTYFDDELSEEEVDFMCGTYYSYNNDGTMDKVSWWPRPQAWAASGLNVGFWST